MGLSDATSGCIASRILRAAARKLGGPAQQSARRRWDNQDFPLCLEHALGDLNPVRELSYRPAAVSLPHHRPGR
jgi:hypothetical protein